MLCGHGLRCGVRVWRSAMALCVRCGSVRVWRVCGVAWPSVRLWRTRMVGMRCGGVLEACGGVGCALGVRCGCDGVRCVWRTVALCERCDCV